MSRVYAGTPAYTGGLSVNDEIVAVNGTRVSTKTLTDRLKDISIGDKAKLLISREGLMQTVEMTASGPPYDSFVIKKTESPSKDQKQLFEGWLGTSWEK